VAQLAQAGPWPTDHFLASPESGQRSPSLTPERAPSLDRPRPSRPGPRQTTNHHRHPSFYRRAHVRHPHVCRPPALILSKSLMGSTISFCLHCSCPASPTLRCPCALTIMADPAVHSWRRPQAPVFVSVSCRRPQVMSPSHATKEALRRPLFCH
jgi:hypothetical protein